MDDATIARLQDVIRSVHDAESRFAWRERVMEVSKGEVLWDVEVLAFELEGHAWARRCFAWELDGTVTVVLAEDRGQRAHDVVRTALRGS